MTRHYRFVYTNGICTGVFSIGDIPNNNGYIFPTEVISEAIDLARHDIEEKKVLGYFNRTDYNKAPPLETVSHVIEDISQDGNEFSASVRILDTPNGKVLKSLIESGVDMEFNASYCGSISGNEAKKLHFQTIDIVPIKD